MATCEPVRRARLAGPSSPVPAEATCLFIELLTDPGDLVVDFFGGSNTSGRAAEV
jgi:DNA modification methylase